MLVSKSKHIQFNIWQCVYISCVSKSQILAVKLTLSESTLHPPFPNTAALLGFVRTADVQLRPLLVTEVLRPLGLLNFEKGIVAAGFIYFFSIVAPNRVSDFINL